MSIEVESLWKYPITGGPGIFMESADLLAGGIRGDRSFIVAVQDGSELHRLGSKQAPELLGIEYDSSGDIVYLNGHPLPLPYDDKDISHEAADYCDEFGDATPVHFCGPDYDGAFSDYLDRPVFFLQKTPGWMRGLGIAPRLRANAPLHIIGRESVEVIAENVGLETADVRRYKPNIVLKELYAHEELDMIGKIMKLGRVGSSVVIQIDRGTPRCVVTSFDPETGENLHDISLRSMPKAENRDGKPVYSAGVYGHPVNVGEQLAVGDSFIEFW